MKCKWVAEGASPLNLGQCFSMDNQGHNHAVIIPLSQSTIIKRNGKCLWKIFDDEKILKISSEYEGIGIKNKRRPRKT